jgi:hypothetical protein
MLFRSVLYPLSLSSDSLDVTDLFVSIVYSFQ